MAAVKAVDPRFKVYFKVWSTALDYNATLKEVAIPTLPVWNSLTGYTRNLVVSDNPLEKDSSGHLYINDKKQYVDLYKIGNGTLPGLEAIEYFIKGDNSTGPAGDSQIVTDLLTTTTPGAWGVLRFYDFKTPAAGGIGSRVCSDVRPPNALHDPGYCYYTANTGKASFSQYSSQAAQEKFVTDHVSDNTIHSIVRDVYGAP
jgi:hypothetical protein